MRHVQLDTYGPPQVLHLVKAPDPRPGPGQVLVHTAAAGITFIDTQLRAGRSPRPGPLPPTPVVLGNGVEGTVVEVGPGGDTDLVGRRVVTSTGGTGGYADLVLAAAADVITVPDALPPGHAVALVADGRTALALARAAELVPGDRVLVTAAAGGVGSLLVQLARTAGARPVVAAASSRAKLDLARSLGADVAVDYTEAGWSDQVRRATGGLDVVFDGVGGAIGTEALALLDPGARALVYGVASGTRTDTGEATLRGIVVVPGHTLIGSPEENRALVEEALAQAAAGRLRPTIGQTFPLDRAADAHAAMEARATLGKTLLLPDPLHSPPPPAGGIPASSVPEPVA